MNPGDIFELLIFIAVLLIVFLLIGYMLTRNKKTVDSGSYVGEQIFQMYGNADRRNAQQEITYQREDREIAGNPAADKDPDVIRFSDPSEET